MTLILLSVITFMTVSFLAISRRERGSVSTTADQNAAKLAAEAALDRATAQIISRMLAATNRFSLDFLVSTNFINSAGFTPNLRHPGNVNYDYLVGGGQLSANDMMLNVANLFYDPRPPVFVRTNRAVRTLDFRYYLDLNRNGRFDDSGWLPVLNSFGQPIVDAGGTTNYAWFVGDPQWIGILERPSQLHSATNRFIARYAYMVVPSGRTLDLNAIHNQAKRLGPANDGFFRNQGVGTWEINLAAFLTDLNENFWGPPAPYSYNTNVNLFSTGAGFNDALALLQYRYGNSYMRLQTARDYFGGRADTVFGGDRIDAYSDGPLMTENWLYFDNDDVNQPWPGSDSPNRFFTLQELFDPAKTSILFTNRLSSAGTNNDSYNRYTFYRLMSQLGTDSAPEPADKININYVNIGGLKASNLVSWTDPDLVNGNPARQIPAFGRPGPELFFTATAEKLLGVSYGVGLGISNIYVYVSTNAPPVGPRLDYTPNVHRLLQLAANIFDATTNRVVLGNHAFPTVFRPIFRRDAGGNIFIAAYVEETNTRLIDNAPPMVDPENASARNQIRPVGTPINPADSSEPMIAGVPVVIGAKKGFPNFNEFALQTVVQVARKLELRKQTLGGPVVETNQMYLLGISNVFGIEAWNSYLTNYPRPLEIRGAIEISSLLTNELADPVARVVRTNWYSLGIITNSPNPWPAYAPRLYNQAQPSFQVPAQGGYWFVTNSVYQQLSAGGGFLMPLNASFQRDAGFRVPQWYLSIKSRVWFALIDRSVNRIVDYVNLNALETGMDITAELMGQQRVDPREPGGAAQSVWRTNRIQNSLDYRVPTEGIVYQIEISKGNIPTSDSDWASYSQNPVTGKDREKAIDAFRVFMGDTPINYPELRNTNLVMQAPYIPARKIYQHTSWQANDPLVHYTVGDLMDLQRTNEVNLITPPVAATPAMPYIGRLNKRYRPWGGHPAESADPNRYNLSLKDPLVRSSDDWDFPTNKFPNIGWLGRVHRGTPWQTVYLKSPSVDSNEWARWTGNPFVDDARRSQPTNDWAILEMFTTALNENSTRGQLSINQSGLAAWSAVLSGVVVLTNDLSDGEFSANAFQQARFTPYVISPAAVSGGTNSALARIVDGINRERARKDAAGNFIHPQQTFLKLGDILSVPELTVASPFLNTSSAVQRQRGLSDAAYERIPQQILSLLRSDDPARFVVYAYGQALKPADRSIVTGGPFVGLCTNYQVMAEVAVRAVVRVDGNPDPRTATTDPTSPFYQTDPRRRYPLRAVTESFNFLPPE